MVNTITIISPVIDNSNDEIIQQVEDTIQGEEHM